MPVVRKPLGGELLIENLAFGQAAKVFSTFVVGTGTLSDDGDKPEPQHGGDDDETIHGKCLLDYAVAARLVVQKMSKPSDWGG